MRGELPTRIKNYTPIQLPLSSPPSSQGQTAMRILPFTQGLDFRPAGNLLYRLLWSNEMFVSWQERPVELHYLKWQSVCYFYDCTIFARKQRYKHNCSLSYSLLLSYTISIHLRQYLVQVSPGLANSGAGINNWFLFVIIEQLLYYSFSDEYN